MSEQLKLAKQWVAKATSDLLSADNNLSASQVPYDTVCFHCQQAAEKLLKAFLVVNAIPPPHTHDLLVLLEEVLKINPSAEMLRETLVLLMPYAVEVRYPDEWFEPSAEDSREARIAVDRVLDWVVAASPELTG